MLESAKLTISSVATFILFLNILCLFRALKGKKDLKWFLMYLVWSFFIEIIAPEYGKYFGNNLPLLHLYTLLEFIFLSLFYWEILISKLKYKKYFFPFLIIMVFLIIGNSIFLEPLTSFNSNAKGGTQIVIMSYTIIYFFNRISVDIKSENMVLNRVNAAVLLYYAGSLFIFIFAQFLLESLEVVNRMFWLFNSILYLVYQLLVLIAAWRLVFFEKKLEE